MMKENSPLVSVVIPTYNCARYLPDAVASVWAQTRDAFEIIVIDDGSTDKTKVALKPFMDKIFYIDFVNNKGLPFARNTGIQQSQGEYVAFLDADDIWLPEKLQTSLDYFERYPEIGMVYSKHINIDEKGCIRAGKIKRSLPSGNIFQKLYSEENFVICSSVVVRKEVFYTAGTFDTGLINCQDWDLWLRIAYYYKVAGINKALTKYRHSSKSLSKNRTNVLKYQKVVLEKIYRQFKDGKTGISDKLYKKRLASHYAKVGRYYLRIGEKRLANENFRLSLKLKPQNLRTLRYYLFHS